MRPSLLAVFVAGVVTGGLGTWWLRDGEEPPRRSPRAAVEVVPGAGADPDRPLGPAAARPAPPAGAAEAPPSVPEEPIRESEERGVLLVDCRGSDVDPDDVDVAGLTILGDVDHATLRSVEDGIARFTLWPGRYTAEWEDASGERRVGVAVRGGATTTLRVTDPRRPGEDPFRPGFGRLEVRAFDLENRPLREAYLSLFGRTVDRLEEVGLETGEGGTCSVDVRPGSYSLRLGGQEREVEVTVGQTAVVEFRYRDEGEVEVRGPVSGMPRLTPLDLREVVESVAMVQARPDGLLLLYVPPGGYELALQLPNEPVARPLGRIRVAPLRRTVVAPEFPTGCIDVRMRGGDAELARRALLVVAERLDGPELPQRAWVNVGLARGADGAWGGRTWFARLPPGRYRLSCAPGLGFSPWAGEVELGEGTSEVVIGLERRVR